MKATSKYVFVSPVFVSASLFLLAALLTIFLPIEVSLSAVGCARSFTDIDVKLKTAGKAAL